MGLAAERLHGDGHGGQPNGASEVHGRVTGVRTRTQTALHTPAPHTAHVVCVAVCVLFVPAPRVLWRVRPQVCPVGVPNTNRYTAHMKGSSLQELSSVGPQLRCPLPSEVPQPHPTPPQYARLPAEVLARVATHTREGVPAASAGDDPVRRGLAAVRRRGSLRTYARTTAAGVTPAPQSAVTTPGAHSDYPTYVLVTRTHARALFAAHRHWLGLTIVMPAHRAVDAAVWCPRSSIGWCCAWRYPPASTWSRGAP